MQPMSGIFSESTNDRARELNSRDQSSEKIDNVSLRLYIEKNARKIFQWPLRRNEKCRTEVVPFAVTKDALAGASIRTSGFHRFTMINRKRFCAGREMNCFD